MTNLDAKIPEGPIAEKWTNHKNKINVVNPANKRAIDVIVVGTGLAGGSAAALPTGDRLLGKLGLCLGIGSTNGRWPGSHALGLSLQPGRIYQKRQGFNQNRPSTLYRLWCLL